MKCWNCGNINISKVPCDFCKRNPKNLPKKFKECFAYVCQDCGTSLTDYHHDH